MNRTPLDLEKCRESLKAWDGVQVADQLRAALTLLWEIKAATLMTEKDARLVDLSKAILRIPAGLEEIVK